MNSLHAIEMNGRVMKYSKEMVVLRTILCDLKLTPLVRGVLAEGNGTPRIARKELSLMMYDVGLQTVR